MKTTIDLPENLFRSVEKQAASLGLEVSQFIASTLARELQKYQLSEKGGIERELRTRSNLPTIRSPYSILNVSPESLGQLDSEDDLASYDKST